MLVLRSQIGDEAAFGELLEIYGPHLLRFTRKMMDSSPAQVEDLVQETWVAIYHGVPSLLDATKFRAWPLPYRSRPDLSRTSGAENSQGRLKLF